MNPPDIKLICTDIDGTLLNADRWLSKETISAIAKIQVPLILASSRPPQAMRYLQKGLHLSKAPLIAFNGGLVIGAHGAVLEDHSFSTDVLKQLITHHSQHTYNLSIYSHEYWFTDREDAWSLREIHNTRSKPTYQTAIKSLAFLEEKKLGIHKLMCMGKPEDLDDLIRTMKSFFGAKVHLYRSKDTYLEITPKHTDKAKALQTLLTNTYNFGMEQVMSFGDNHNDVELIRKTGYGVAVQNATDGLKAIATYVSPFTNKQHAVAKTIESYFFKK